MTPLPADLHFLRPWWLLALAAPPLLWRVFSRRGRDGGAWRSVVDAHLLEHLLVRGEPAAVSSAPRWLAVGAWTLASLALAGPAWQRVAQPLYRNQAARVIALELGSSMAAQDIKPSRFKRARFKIDDILKRSADLQTALIAYAGDAFVVAPLTDDANTVANLVDALDPSVMPADGNDTARAIEMGTKLIRQAGLPSGEIIILADAVSADAVDAARRSLAQGIRVDVLGIGSVQGSPVVLPQGGFLKDSGGNIVLPKLDPADLAAVARAGDGRYVTATPDDHDLDSLLDRPVEQGRSRAPAGQASSVRYLDRGPWLLLLVVPLAALGFRRGWLLLLPLVLLAHAGPASALSWNDLWQRPDQQAQAALRAGHPRQAQAQARDPALRGAAAFRAGDYSAAARDFASGATADAAYNRGNALAKQGHYREAIAAYSQALQRHKNMPDALANKQAVEDWLRRQQRQRDQQQGKSGQQQDGNNKSRAGQQGDDSKNAGKGQKQDSQQNKRGESPDKAQSRAQGGSPQQDAKTKDRAGQQEGATSPQPAARQEDQKARQAFSKDMDRALAQKNKGAARKPKPVRLGAQDDKGAHDEHRQAIEQWLQRVPDDPGGLLRRKFQLEYQQRRNGGDAGDGDQ